MKTLMKKDGLKPPIALNGPSDLKFLPLEKINLTAVWKISSHRMTCETKITNGGYRLQFKLCLKLWTTTPLKE
jgi:hypothetical protein